MTHSLYAPVCSRFIRIALVLSALAAVSVTWAAELTLTWSDNSDNETDFKIERRTEGTSFSQIATVEANVETYIDTGLLEATEYWYQVRASNSAGDSGYTNPASAVTSSGGGALQVDLSSTSDGEVFELGGSVTVSASVSNSDLTDRVELLIDGSVIGQDSNAPYVFLWAGAIAGPHTVQTRAIDLDGNPVLSELITVSVQDSSEPTDPPSVGVYRGGFALPTVGADSGGLPSADGQETGRFAIWVDSNGSIQFMGAETSTGAAFSVSDVTIAGDGSFIVVGTVGVDAVIVRGRITSKGVEGTVDGTDLVLSGGIVDAEGPSGPAVGLYEAYGVRTPDTCVMVMVGGDGLGFVSVSRNGILRTAEVPVEVAGNLATLSSAVLNSEITLDFAAGSAEGIMTVEGGQDIWLMGLRSDILALRRLENISTRGVIAPSGGIMITGFVVSGTEPKDVLIRAVGPGLAAFGVPGAVTDPVLELMSDSGSIATNIRWIAGNVGSVIDTVSAQVGAFPLDPSSWDAVLLVTVAPGRYSAVVTDGTNQGGDTLIEIYDASEASQEGNDLTNLSTRGTVTAENNLIGGFVVAGNAPKRVLVRGIGPGLGAFGINDALPEARLILTQRVNGGDENIDENTGWATQENADAIAEAGLSAGAFDLDPSDADSAMLLWLEPGVYTAIIQPGTNQMSGTALIEVYQTN